MDGAEVEREAVGEHYAVELGVCWVRLVGLIRMGDYVRSFLLMKKKGEVIFRSRWFYLFSGEAIDDENRKGKECGR